MTTSDISEEFTLYAAFDQDGKLMPQSISTSWVCAVANGGGAYMRGEVLGFTVKEYTAIPVENVFE